MSERRVLAVLFGGRSVEHEVSLVSGRTVIESADPDRYEVVPVLLDRDGLWYTGEADALLEAERSGPPGPRILPPADPGDRRLRTLEGEAASPVLDVAFPIVHGAGGEDGLLQGLLETARIPYVGAGVLASSVCMDKEVSKRLLDAARIAVVPWERVDASEWQARPRDVMRRLEDLQLPLFVKPANGGSSVGVSKAISREELSAALDRALGLDVKAIVEPGLDAREIECAVLGNEDPESSAPCEILPGREFYDYEAKYGEAGSRVIVPAEDLESWVVEKARHLAVEAFRVLGVEGMARVDFLLERETDRLYVNEVNTLPGFTAISVYPQAWAHGGVSLPKLVDRLVELALERAARRDSLRTRWESGD
jgi:D-alanine-D-alanine ligase